MPDAGTRYCAHAIAIAVIALVAGIAVTVDAIADWPRSRAERLSSTSVLLSAMVRVADRCTDVASLELRGPASGDVVARLAPTAGAVCPAIATIRHREAILPVPRGVDSLTLEIVAADGDVLATEIVPVD